MLRGAVGSPPQRPIYPIRAIAAEDLRNTLPDGPVFELKREPVGRIKCALGGPLDPDMAWIIDPSPHRHAGLEGEIPSVLRYVGDTAELADAPRHALPSAGQIYILRRSAGHHRGRQRKPLEVHGRFD